MVKKIFVYADWLALNNRKPAPVGILYSDIVNNREKISFEYSNDWLGTYDTKRIFLDPDLKPRKGLQYKDKSKKNFGIFMDCAPDGWGRELMLRMESVLAKKEKRGRKHLFESDFLLGVNDMSRMGGLRFKEDETGDFLSNNKSRSVLPVASMKELERLELASFQFEEDALEDGRKIKWMEDLFKHGSSIGGARPKVSVKDGGDLWIAKFPSKDDRTDVGAWELVAHDLAKECGIVVPDASIKLLSHKGHTYLSKRFDRVGNLRIHFASAMTMIGADDMEGESYLDIAEFIIKHGANVKSDLKELWSRIVFNICIANTDDHLRNHGFLLTPAGWNLSPAYDMNPSMYPKGLCLNISETSNELDLGLALDVAKYFYLNNKEANSILHKIRATVKSDWRWLAGKYGITKSEQSKFSDAFNRKF
jgi:serine/threonine-protein kinase HipA